jgi:hypothetical protein
VTAKPPPGTLKTEPTTTETLTEEEIEKATKRKEHTNKLRAARLAKKAARKAERKQKKENKGLTFGRENALLTSPTFNFFMFSASAKDIEEWMMKEHGENPLPDKIITEMEELKKWCAKASTWRQCAIHIFNERVVTGTKDDKKETKKEATDQTAGNERVTGTKDENKEDDKTKVKDKKED